MQIAIQLVVLSTVCSACGIAGENPDETPTPNQSKELIVLAAPITGDQYYAGVADDIFHFHVQYARQIENHDNVLILADKGAYDRYAEALGGDKVALAPMADIWVRDYGLSNAERPVMFRYTAAGQSGRKQGQRMADSVQDDLATLAERAGLKFRETDLLNDGGNFVDDYAGNAVVSRKLLRDNDLTEEQARAALRELTGVKNVAFIESDEQGGLEHADGVVAFVAANTLIVNSYDDYPGYARELRDDLERGLPGVIIHEIVTPYDDSKIYDNRFGSACGLYTNALVTPNRVYLPQFGVPEDEIAIEQVGAATTREIVSVPSHQVCHMGGGVRCMSWQLRGENANALLEYLKEVE